MMFRVFAKMAANEQGLALLGYLKNNPTTKTNIYYVNNGLNN